MKITASTALRKIKAGTATVTGRIAGEYGVEYIAIDDHEMATVHHVEISSSPSEDEDELEMIDAWNATFGYINN
jgi:hypothetical protein